MKIKNYYKPAIGGLLTGGVGLVAIYLFPYTDGLNYGVLAAGYGIIQQALFSQAGIGFLLFVVFGKILTTSFSIGSGGSGGVFGPSVVIGGSLGGAIGLIFNYLFPSLEISTVSFVLVGIAGFFSAIANTPISTIIMVSEMSNNFELLIPALWVSFISYLILNKYSLYTSQLQCRFHSPVHRNKIKRILAKFKN